MNFNGSIDFYSREVKYFTLIIVSLESGAIEENGNDARPV